LPNTITGFLETFVAAAADYNEAVVGQLALLDAVYKDVKPEVARAGKTINVYFPDVAPVVDQGNADWTPEDINPNYISLVFTQRPGKAILIRDFEQYLTSVEIRDKYVGPLYKRCAEYLNAQIAALITPANFPANAPILGATAGEVTVADQLNAWNGLANAKVPLDDSNDLALLVHNNVYQKMLADPQWVQENVVSSIIAREARQEGKLSNAFKFKPVWDQQMPTASATVLQGRVAVTNGSTAVTGTSSRWTVDLTAANYVTFGNDATQTPYALAAINSDTSLTLASAYAGPTATTSIKRKLILAGTVAVSSGSNAVTGTGTSFTTALNVGDWLLIQGDPTGTPYQVQSIASNTALTLASNYAGATASGKLATVQNYTCLALHRYAIALALRPLPEPDANTIHFRYVDIKGIPMRLMASYQHLKNGWLVSLDFGYALAVIRPEFGQIIKV
jgi:hypothetical protein